jgi:hypothetical protein
MPDPTDPTPRDPAADELRALLPTDAGARKRAFAALLRELIRGEVLR